MEQKRKNTFANLQVVIIVLLLLIIGYLIYDKFVLSKDGESSNNAILKCEEQSKEEIQSDDSDNSKKDESKILSWHDIILVDEKSVNELNEDEIAILLEVNDYLIDRIDDKLFNYLDKTYRDLNEMTNEDKLWLMYWITKDDSLGMGIEDYTSDQIQAMLLNRFGSDFEITFDDIDDIWKYNSDTKKYTPYGGGTGVEITEPIKMKLTKYEEKNNKYYLTYKTAYYISHEGPDLDAYNAKKEKIGSLDQYQDSDDMRDGYLSNESFNKLYDKLVETTYVFEKYNDKLVMTGYIVE